MPIETTTMSDAELRDELRGAIIICFNGQTFKPGDLMTRFNALLREKNIPGLSRQKFNNIFYTLVDNMKREGILDSVGRGLYVVSTDGVFDLDDDGDNLGCSDDIDETEATTVIGEGSAAVYLFYYPSYKKLSELSGVSEYPCKIGQTSDIDKRFSSRTELPEKRVIALQLLTDDPVALERLIHSALKLQGRQMLTSPGKEWYMTNPESVIRLYNHLVQLCAG